eukprot:4214304-Alexandrium_andersonii.AAC.1
MLGLVNRHCASTAGSGVTFGPPPAQQPAASASGSSAQGVAAGRDGGANRRSASLPPTRAETRNAHGATDRRAPK